MSVQSRQVAGACKHGIEQALRTEWRMIERVSLRRRGDGQGYSATIRLNQTLIRGAAEQQGLHCSAAAAKLAWARRVEVIDSCVEHLNSRLPATESIRDFEVV